MHFSFKNVPKNIFFNTKLIKIKLYNIKISLFVGQNRQMTRCQYFF